MQQYIGTGRIGTSQNVAYTGTAGISRRLERKPTRYGFSLPLTHGSQRTALLRVRTAGAYVPALSPEYFTVTPGQATKAVQVAAGGTLYMTEII